VGIRCRSVSVCPSVRLSQVAVLLKRLNVRSRKQCRTIAIGTLVFWRRKFRQKLKRGIPNGGAKCRRGTLNAAEVAENWRLSTRSVVNWGRLQVYRTFAVLQCVARGLSVTAILVQSIVISLYLWVRDKTPKLRCLWGPKGVNTARETGVVPDQSSSVRTHFVAVADGRDAPVV